MPIPSISLTDPAASPLPDKPAPDFLNANPADTIGLCLSGGGYRAMLYHVGALIRMNEMGLLPRLGEISVVSGAALVGAQLGLAWKDLTFNDKGVATNLIEEVAEPLVRFAHVKADIPSVIKGVLKGLLLPHAGPAMELAAVYDKHLFHGARLADLPDAPRIAIQASNLQTLEGFQFTKAEATDDRVGFIRDPAFRLARAVAASSAFPPFLSPVHLDMTRQVVVKRPGDDLHDAPFIDEAVLTDGGVRDNMGLKDVLMNCRTVLVSNAGAIVPQIGEPTGRWLGQFARVVNMMQYQAEQADETTLNGLDAIGQRHVAVWKIGRPVTDYGVADPLPLTPVESQDAAALRTRLSTFSNGEIALAMRAGYAGADASLRVKGFGTDAPAGDFAHLPRPDTGRCVALVR